MTISVIIPCYNAAAYLEECLQSVLAQTMASFEIIIVDDGSKDDTLAIAQRAARLDARIRVLHQENAGVGAARNAGLDAAQGEYVTFVDGDDLLVPDAFEVMLQAAKGGADMVVCAHETFDDTGGREVFYPETCWWALEGEAQRHAAALRLIEGDSVLNIMCNKLHRRALLEGEGIRLCPGLRIAEDALFNLEAVLAGHGIAYVGRIAYRYRMHAQSAMHRSSGSVFEMHIPWFGAMRAMLQRRGMMERYYRAFLDTVALRLYKDGGAAGVMRDFNRMARPVLPDQELDRMRMSAADRLLLAIVRRGLYPCLYPLIYPVQVAARKLSALAFRLRAKKEMPV